MSRLFSVFVLSISLLVFHSSGFAQSPPVKLVPESELIYRVVAPNELLAKKAMISFHGELLEQENGAMILELSSKQRSDLESLGFELVIAEGWKDKWQKKQQQMIQQAENEKLSSTHGTGINGYSCYATVEETFAAAQAFESAYPNLAEWIDIGDSWEKTAGLTGYDIMVLKLTNRQIVKQKPILFIQSSMHAREYTPAALTLDFATDLLARYQFDADVQWILDHHEIHLAIQVNPDARKQAENKLSWRKNTNTAYCGSTSTNRGADLNRNFSFTWAQANNGSSTDQCNSTFRGDGPASEPETQAIENYIKSIYPDRRGEGISDASPDDIQGIHLDIHSFSELILWPWGHTNSIAPNVNQLARLGRRFTYWNGYRPMQSIGLYPTDGTSESVSYGELGVPEITFELGKSFFEPCINYTSKIRPENMPALYYAAKAVSAPFQLPFGPDIVTLKLNGNTNAQLQAGDALQVTGIAEDGRYDTSGTTVDVQNISQVNAYIDLAPWEAGSVAISLSALDGAFDASLENYSGSIDTTNLIDGRHIVYLQAMDTGNQVGVVSAAFIQVGNAENLPPVASFTTNCNSSGCQFDASASSDDSSISRFDWDFGDGTIASEPVVSKRYMSEGVFLITLTVTDDYGLQSMQTLEYTLQVDPSATFSVQCTFLNCTLDGSSSYDLSGDIVSYSWLMSDGATYSTANVSHTFSQTDSYSVTLTVVDDEGNSGDLTRTVIVQAKPIEQPIKSGGGGSFSLLFTFCLILLTKLVGRKFRSEFHQ